MKLKYGLFIFILATIFLIVGGALAYFLDEMSNIFYYLWIGNIWAGEKELSTIVIIFRGLACLLYWISFIYIIFFWTFFFDMVNAKNKLIIDDLKRSSGK